jgi:octaprenyl-diphosphate synthase
MDLATIRQLVEADLAATDAAIETCLHANIPLITQIGKHLIQSGGKKLRPLVVLLGAHAFGYQEKNHIPIAAIIELIHSATLLHDDVVDSSELRRGQKTANVIWGNSASVLVGDFIYSRAFQMMAKINNLQILSTLADATNTIASGEILQLLNCKNPDTDETRYLDVIHAKTGTLFATAAPMGAILCARTEHEVHLMAQYGKHLGIAFQLIDDALDYSTNSETLGKNQADDLAEGKPTLPLLYALKHGTTEQMLCIRNAIEHADRSNLDVILATIESTGAIQYTYDTAQKHVDKALSYLSEIPDSLYKNALSDLANFAIQRKY